MNIREGIKRIYIALSVLILAVLVWASYEDAPTQQTVANRFYFDVTGEFASVNKMEPSQINWGGRDWDQIVRVLCVTPWDVDEKRAIGIHEGPSCKKYKEGIADLPNARSKHITKYTGIILGFLAGAVAVFFVARWIGRGFFAPRS